MLNDNYEISFLAYFISFKVFLKVLLKCYYKIHFFIILFDFKTNLIIKLNIVIFRIQKLVYTLIEHIS